MALTDAAEGRDSAPESGPQSRPTVTMDLQQMRVFEELAGVHPDLGSYYYGAVAVLSDTSNPEGPYQAAHSLRELMEKLPKYRDVDVAGGVGQLKQVAQRVQKWWLGRKVQGFRCHAGQCELEGEELAGLLDELDSMLVRSMTRGQEAEAALRSFDPAGADVDSRTLTDWRRLRGKLSDLSHHSDTIPPESASDLLVQFGSLFLSLASPTPSDDLSLLDEIMREVEAADG